MDRSLTDFLIFFSCILSSLTVLVLHILGIHSLNTFAVLGWCISLGIGIAGMLFVLKALFKSAPDLEDTSDINKSK